MANHIVTYHESSGKATMSMQSWVKCSCGWQSINYRGGLETRRADLKKHEADPHLGNS